MLRRQSHQAAVAAAVSGRRAVAAVLAAARSSARRTLPANRQGWTSTPPEADSTQFGKRTYSRLLMVLENHRFQRIL